MACDRLSSGAGTNSYSSSTSNCIDYFEEYLLVDNPNYQRLTFALLGVATPSDLIQDKSRTPFNIGGAIELQGFKLHETDALQLGFSGNVKNPSTVMAGLVGVAGLYFKQANHNLNLAKIHFTIASAKELSLSGQERKSINRLL